MAHLYPVYPCADSYCQPPGYCQPVGVRRYQIRQRIFSLVDKYAIKDESGQEVFSVRGKAFSHGRRLVLEDIAGNALVNIHRLIRLRRTYEILSARNGDLNRELAVVKKEFSLFHAKFEIESVYGNYHIEGIDITARSFVITKQGKVVATINRKFFTMADTYGVEIATSEDSAFILALAIVIDQVIDDSRQH